MTSSPLYDTYIRADLAFEKGEGSWLTMANGDRYLDFAAGIAVNSLGHAHPHLVAALTDQASRLWHVSNIYEIPGQRKLADRLCQRTFADKVFFTNSGAEAMECAIKTARRYHYAKGAPEKYRIITFEGAFHGRTLATIAAGGQAKYLEGFGPKSEGFDQVPFADVEALENMVSNETAAVLIEPIQGEGGVRMVSHQCMRDIRSVCDEHGLLLILDEIQCGVGRTGKLFAHEWAGIVPDLMAIAKGIGGGFPIGACLATQDAAQGMIAGTHGTTYGGNPLAMAVGNAVLDIVLEDGFLDTVIKKSLLLKQGLAQIVDAYPQLVEAFRGEGLLLGLKCVAPNTTIVSSLRDEGLLTVGAGDNVVRILPPLTVSENDIRIALDKMNAALAKLSNSGQTH